MKIKRTLEFVLAFSMIATLTTPVQAKYQPWILIDGKWTYTAEDGSLATGWQFIDGCWYTFADDGSMKTGWVAGNEKWYFVGESGVMQDTGWVNYEGADYYLKGTGVMATDFFKDGYELDSTGKAIPMTQTKSVELTEQTDINNKTIEGNLYIDATKFKELELSGITVTGKLVIMGEEVPDAKITIKDSTINTISSQVRGVEMTLAGTTSVINIQIEENSAIKPAEDFTGKVETIEIQSTAKKEVKVEVPAQSVTSNTFAPVSINAPVDNLAVNKKTELKVNANIENITVNSTATDTKVEVGKGSTVGTINSETKVDIGGAGKVDEIKGDDITSDIKPPKPSDDDRPTPPVTPDNNVAQVGDKKYTDINTAIQEAAEGQEVILLKDITLSAPIVIEREITLNGDGKILAMPSSVLQSAIYASAVVVKVTDNVTIKDLNIKVTGTHNRWQGYYGIQVYDSRDVILNNITSTGADGGILINGASTLLTGKTIVTGNEFGGVEVSNGVDVNGASLTLEFGATVENDSETYDNPTLWTISTNEITGFSLTKGPDIMNGSEIKNHYYSNKEYAASFTFVKTADELKAAIKNPSSDIIVLSEDIEITSDTDVETSKTNFTLDLNGHTMNGNTSSSSNQVTVGFNSGTTQVKNGQINALSGTYCTIRVRNAAIVNLEYMVLYNETKNGNSIKASETSVVNISNTKSTSVMGGGMEAMGGTINVLENNTFTQTGYFNHNSTIGAASKGGILNIDEGTFSNSENFGLYVFNSGGTINIKGGTFTAGKAVLKADSDKGATSIINISGGTFDGNIEIAEGAKLNITAGVFTNTGKILDEFTEYVVTGSTVKEDNNAYVVTVDTQTPKEPVDLITQPEEELAWTDIEEPASVELVDLTTQPEAVLPWTNIEEPKKEDKITA